MTTILKIFKIESDNINGGRYLQKMTNSIANKKRLYRVVVDWHNDDGNVFDFCGNAWASNKAQAIKLIAKRTATYYSEETEGDDYESDVREIVDSIYPDRVTDVVDELYSNLQQLILGQRNSANLKKRETYSQIIEILRNIGITQSCGSNGIRPTLEDHIAIYRYIETPRR